MDLSLIEAPTLQFDIKMFADAKVSGHGTSNIPSSSPT
jgi:hypothetical protein